MDRSQPKLHTRLSDKTYEFRKSQVLATLRLLGADEYDLLLPETRSLPRLLEEGEILQGVIFGKYRKEPLMHRGRGLLAVTDRRILLVDKKPLFLHFDDISLTVVSGIEYNSVGVGESVILSTRMGDIHMRTFNRNCARQFIKATEDMLFQVQQGKIT